MYSYRGIEHLHLDWGSGRTGRGVTLLPWMRAEIGMQTHSNCTKRQKRPQFPPLPQLFQKYLLQKKTYSVTSIDSQVKSETQKRDISFLYES